MKESFRIQKLYRVVNVNYKTVQYAVINVNKLCALITVSLGSLASQIPFLYVVQWNILDTYGNYFT